ncbi:MAG: hypothetical protein OXI75_14075 [Rhodospirillales bacterium]|nr:hypothetical protein [Rhodospirillales bacterium]
MESAEIAHQPFGLYLLLDVQPRVSAQRVGGIVGVPDQGQQSVVEGRPQFEARAELRRHERVHRPHHRPAREEIDAGALELARARPGQHETQAARLLHQLVDDREQLGNPLHLVDHDVDDPRRRRQLAQPLRPYRILALLRRRQQIDPDGVRERRSQPRALAGSARAEQEEVSRRWAKKFPLYRHNESNYGIPKELFALLGTEWPYRPSRSCCVRRPEQGFARRSAAMRNGPWRPHTRRQPRAGGSPALGAVRRHSARFAATRRMRHFLAFRFAPGSTPAAAQPERAAQARWIRVQAPASRSVESA